MDWKEALLAQSRQMGIEPTSEPADAVADTEQSSQGYDPRHAPPLHVVVERKGRGGKTATIIEGFDCDQATLEQIASRLKKKLGAGGSARGLEILIQGERLQAVRTALAEMGYRLKG